MFYLLAGHFLEKLINDNDFNSLEAEKQEVLNMLRNDYGKGGCAGILALMLSNNFTTVSRMWDKVV